MKAIHSTRLYGVNPNNSNVHGHDRENFK